MDVKNNIKLLIFSTEIHDHTFSTNFTLLFRSLCRYEVEIELNSRK